MKLNKKGLIFLPLLALCLSGCVSTLDPDDKPEQEEGYYTPEGEHDLDNDTNEDEDSSSTTDSTYSYTLKPIYINPNKHIFACVFFYCS